MRIKEFLINMSLLFVLLSLLYIFYNIVFSLVCLSEEGDLKWNKVVVACHFDETLYVVNQQIVSSSIDSICYRNGVLINCTSLKGDSR